MGFVYVMECETPDEKTFCKVGITEHDISQRIKAIQTGCPFEIRRTWVSRNIPDYQQCEKVIHNELREHRSKGEWFSVPFVRACAVADRVCNTGFRGIALKLIDELQKEQRCIRKRIDEIDGEIDSLRYDIRNCV